MKDLAPVTMIGTTPNLLVVAPSFPARSASDLIRMAREKPGGITYATGGFGSSSHLAVALFSFLSGAKFNHVPYKGAGPALADVVGGHVDFTVATMPGAIQQVRSSGLRAAEEFSVAGSTAVKWAAAVGGEWQRPGETARRQCLASGGTCDGGAGYRAAFHLSNAIIRKFNQVEPISPRYFASWRWCGRNRMRRLWNCWWS